MDEIVSIDDLKQDPRNANKGTERGQLAVNTSIRESGAGRSILLDKEGNTIAGNKTLEAARLAGLPVRIIRTDGSELVAVMREDLDIDSPEARKMAVADNRTAELGLEWDVDELAAMIEDGVPLGDLFELDEFDELGIDLDLLGGGDFEDGDAEPELSRADELRDEWGVETGQLWILPSRTAGQEHRLICGDCTDAGVVERVMGVDKIDCSMTDPPYGVDYDGGTTSREKLAGDESTRLYLPALQRIKENAQPHIAVYLWYADGDAAIAQAVAQAGFTLRRRLIWNKNQAQYGALSQQYKQKHEPVLYLHLKGKSPYWAGDGTEVTVWDADRHSVNEFHPTQKPPTLYERAYMNSSKIGDIVYDAFSGGGSAFIAAENLARQCRAVEISPAYVAVALQRYQDAFGITATLA